MEHIRLNCNHAVLSCDFDFKWKTLIKEEEYFSTNVNSSIKYSNVKPTLAIVHYLLYTEDFTQPSSSDSIFFKIIQRQFGKHEEIQDCLSKWVKCAGNQCKRVHTDCSLIKTI